MSELFVVDICHNPVTPNWSALLKQLSYQSLDSDKDLLASRIAAKILQDMAPFSNPALIIGHSQGASVMDKVLTHLSN